MTRDGEKFLGEIELCEFPCKTALYNGFCDWLYDNREGNKGNDHSISDRLQNN